MTEGRGVGGKRAGALELKQRKRNRPEGLTIIAEKHRKGGRWQIECFWAEGSKIGK